MANAIADDFDKNDMKNTHTKTDNIIKFIIDAYTNKKMVKIVNVIYVVQLFNFVI